MPHRDDAEDRDADERAWQDIVENFGDRAELDDPAPPAAPDTPPAGPPASAAPFGGRFGDPAAYAADDATFVEDDDEEAEEEGYEPPEPPPLPVVSPDRALAWAGVFGSPALLLVALLLSITIPGWLGYLLILGFVGGFVYLVATMPREPRDPWDDGAQV